MRICTSYIYRPKAYYYRVVQKTETQFYLGTAPILTILSLLQAEIYCA